MILESNCSNYFYTFPSASNIFVKMKLEIKSKYSLMYDQLTLFLSTKSSILLQLLQHTKKIIAFLSTWSILYNFKKSREKWQKSSPFLFEFPFCFFNLTFVEALANNIDRWTSLKWPNRTSIRATGESAKNRENREFAMEKDSTSVSWLKKPA